MDTSCVGKVIVCKTSWIVSVVGLLVFCAITIAENMSYLSATLHIRGARSKRPKARARLPHIWKFPTIPNNDGETFFRRHPHFFPLYDLFPVEKFPPFGIRYPTPLTSAALAAHWSKFWPGSLSHFRGVSLNREREGGKEEKEDGSRGKGGWGVRTYVWESLIDCIKRLGALFSDQTR